MADFVKLNGFNVKDPIAREAIDTVQTNLNARISSVETNTTVKIASGVLTQAGWTLTGGVYMQAVSPVFYWGGSAHTDYKGVVTVSPDYAFDDETSAQDWAKFGINCQMDLEDVPRTFVFYADTQPDHSIAIVFTLQLAEDNALIVSNYNYTESYNATVDLTGKTAPYNIEIPELENMSIHAAVPQASAQKTFQIIFNGVTGADTDRAAIFMTIPAGTGTYHLNGTARFYGDRLAIDFCWAPYEGYGTTYRQFAGPFLNVPRRKITGIRATLSTGGAFENNTILTISGRR